MIILTPEETIKLEPTARKFAEAVKIGIDAFLEAGRVVAEAIDLDPKFPEKMAELSKGQFSAKFVRRFEKLGRGHVIPQLIFCWDRPGITKLRQLSPAMQNYYLMSTKKTTTVTGDVTIRIPRISKERLEFAMSLEHPSAQSTTKQKLATMCDVYASAVVSYANSRFPAHLQTAPKSKGGAK